MQAEAAAVIDAPIDQVWRVVIDLAAYPTWNPFVIEIVDPPQVLAIGVDLALRVRWADGTEQRSHERVLQVTPPARGGDGVVRAEFTYRFHSWMHTFGLVRATRVQTLTQRDGGPTRYETREAFTGLTARYVPLAKVQAGFDAHAAALKAACERAVARAS